MKLKQTNASAHLVRRQTDGKTDIVIAYSPLLTARGWGLISRSGLSASKVWSLPVMLSPQGPAGLETKIFSLVSDWKNCRRPRAFVLEPLGLMKMSVMMELVVVVSLQWLSTKVIYLLTLCYWYNAHGTTWVDGVYIENCPRLELFVLVWHHWSLPTVVGWRSGPVCEWIVSVQSGELRQRWTWSGRNSIQHDDEVPRQRIMMSTWVLKPRLKLNPLTPTVTAIKHPVPHRVKPSFVIFDIRALWRSVLSVRVPGCQKLQMTA